jgi:hypothetical protein
MDRLQNLFRHGRSRSRREFDSSIGQKTNDTQLPIEDTFQWSSPQPPHPSSLVGVTSTNQTHSHLSTDQSTVQDGERSLPASHESTPSKNETTSSHAPIRTDRERELVDSATTPISQEGWQVVLQREANIQLELDEEAMFPYEDANPCTVCQSLTLNSILAKGKRATRDVAGGGAKHHETWASLKDSANRECKLCILIRNALLAGTGGAESYLDRAGAKCSVYIRPEACKRGVIVGPIGIDLTVEHSNPALSKTVASCDIGIYTDIGN